MTTIVTYAGKGSQLTTAEVDANFNLLASRPMHQCSLKKSGSILLLSRYNGYCLTINGVVESIPSSGVSLGATGLTASTLYYIYAYMNSGTMTLEASTTGHSTDSATGMEIKTGDASRTLVGMARPIAGPAFQDAGAQRFVRSFFNEGGISAVNTFSANRAITSTSTVEINSEIRCEILVWAGERVLANVSGTCVNNAAGYSNWTGIGIDNTATFETGGQLAYAPVASGAVPINAVTHKLGLTEGYHYLTVLGKVSAGTGTWLPDAGTGAALQVSVVRG